MNVMGDSYLLHRGWGHVNVMGDRPEATFISDVCLHVSDYFVISDMASKTRALCDSVLPAGASIIKFPDVVVTRHIYVARL
jgi:hypothetical protein